MDRRKFLTGLSTAGVALGLSSLGFRRAFADNAEAPKRLIVISHCHGWPYDSWKLSPPPGAGLSKPWERNLTSTSKEALSAPLKALFAHRSRILALDGLSLATAELDTDGNRHDKGWIHAWTGNRADFSGTDSRALSASLDQIVATEIARPDRLSSLEISVDGSGESGRPISYASSGARLPIESAPDRLWQRLFGPSISPDPLALRQRDVLDYAYAEHQALSRSLPKTQHEKLDAHYELVRGLTARIEGMANLSCEEIPKASTSQANYDERFDVFATLIGAALNCDIARVVSLSLGEMPTADFGWDHITDNVHKGLAHQIYDSPEKHQAMSDYLTRHAEQVARLVSTLAALPDGNGSSVMDNTLIVWGSELADGWHGYRHYCPILIGGSWHFNAGRYLHWPHQTPIRVLVPASVNPSGYNQVSGKPHQHLLVSVAQAMGVNTEHVGLEHVQGQGGDFVDCKGPLEGLA